MLHDQDLPWFLWAEACNIVVYLQNRIPHKVLGKLTPEEAFSSKKADLGHIPVEKRTKLEPTAKKGILVGYSETSKAYRVYIPTLRKTMVRRDVKFEEERALQKPNNLMNEGEQSPTIEAAQFPQTSITQVGEQSEQVEQGDQKEESIIPQPQIPITEKRRNRATEQTLREAQEYVGDPQDSVRQRRAPRRYSDYVALMSELIEVKPSNFQEASKHQV